MILREIKYLKEIRIFVDKRRYVFAYLPFVGWLYPFLYLKNELGQHHAKQGFILALIFSVFLLLFSIANVFLSKEWIHVKIAVVVSVYFLYVLYLILCITGAVLYYKERRFNLYLLDRLSKNIKI